MGTIAKLHDKARRAIAAGEGSFRQAAEYLAEARKQGATQRQSAKAIGRSPAWVNTLLKWQASGFKDTPFGPQSKAKRAGVQSPKQSRRPMTAEEALAQTAQAEFQKARAVAVAAMFGADTKRIPAAAPQGIAQGACDARIGARRRARQCSPHCRAATRSPEYGLD
jgi:hypothetical protein